MSKQCRKCGSELKKVENHGIYCPVCVTLTFNAENVKADTPVLDSKQNIAKCKSGELVISNNTLKGMDKAMENLGRKFDNGKPRWDLLPIEEVEEVVKVLTKGAEKYEDHNWQHVDNLYNRYYAAAMRHLKAWKCDSKEDDETGYNHLAHAICCLLFMLWKDNNPENVDKSTENVDNNPENVDKSCSRCIYEGEKGICFDCTGQSRFRKKRIVENPSCDNCRFYTMVDGGSCTNPECYDPYKERCTEHIYKYWSKRT